MTVRWIGGGCSLTRWSPACGRVAQLLEKRDGFRGDEQMMLYCGEGALSETKGVGGRGKRGRGATTVSLLLFSLPPTSSSPQRIVQGFALKRHYFAMLLLLAIPPVDQPPVWHLLYLNGVLFGEDHETNTHKTHVWKWLDCLFKFYELLCTQ